MPKKKVKTAEPEPNVVGSNWKLHQAVVMVNPPKGVPKNAEGRIEGYLADGSQYKVSYRKLTYWVKAEDIVSRD